MGQTTRVVIGVGLNVNRVQTRAEDVSSAAGWLSDALGASIDRTALLAAILRAYEARFDQLVGQPETIVDEWATRAAIVGQRVSVKGIDGAIQGEGVVRRVLTNGALELETAEGVVPVLLGDVDAF